MNGIKKRIGTYYLVFILFFTFEWSQGLLIILDKIPLKYMIIFSEVAFLGMSLFIWLSYNSILQKGLSKNLVKLIIVFNAISPSWFFYKFLLYSSMDQNMLRYLVDVTIPLTISLFFLNLWIQALQKFTHETYRLPKPA